MAERICRDTAAKRGVGLGATSGGIGALNGQTMHPFAAEVLTEKGLDATDFESRYLQPRIVQAADLVLCTTREHRAARQRMVPARWKRMFTLIEFVELVSILNGDAQREADSAPSIETIMASRGRIDTNSAHLDILDPMGQPKADFERVYRELSPQVGALVQWARRSVVGQ